MRDVTTARGSFIDRTYKDRSEFLADFRGESGEVAEADFDLVPSSSIIVKFFGV